MEDGGHGDVVDFGRAGGRGVGHWVIEEGGGSGGFEGEEGIDCLFLN